MKPSVNWLLALIPVTLALERGGAPAPWVFFIAAVAILPVARLIVRSTEQLSAYTGDAVGALLNATFGNAPELIIALVALRAGLLDMVRASIVGAILANLLLALGLAFLVGGVRFHTQTYREAAARMYGSMMLIAAISLTVPSAFNRVFAPEETLREEALLNVGLALVLLPRAIAGLLTASVLAAWMSEVLVGAAEATGAALGMSDVFIGIVVLAIVGGAAESGSAIAMARENRMDLAVGIALGSCIQIALFVAPVLVLASYVLAPRPLELSFSRPEIGSLFMAVLIGAHVAGNGRANWYKGVQLVTVYLIIALMFYLLPTAS